MHILLLLIFACGDKEDEAGGDSGSSSVEATTDD